MRSLLIALLLNLLAGGAALSEARVHDPTQVPAGRYELDPKHASLVVRVMHMGYSRYTMRFRTLSGAFDYDPANWRTGAVTIVVDPKSLDTEDAAFNRTITGWFEPDKYPTIQFTGTGLTQTADNQGELTGDLTFHGVSRPVVLHVAFNGAGPGLLGAGLRVGFSGSGHLKRSDFNVTAMRGYVGDDVDLEFEVEFFRK